VYHTGLAEPVPENNNSLGRVRARRAGSNPSSLYIKMADQGIKVCHSEEANSDTICLVPNNRPTKNLSFPKGPYVFFGGTDFQ
jgi:hypothetical protein